MRYELHKSKISDDFVHWFRNGEEIFQAVFRKNSLKMSVLYWRVPYIYKISPLFGYPKIEDNRKKEGNLKMDSLKNKDNLKNEGKLLN